MPAVGQCSALKLFLNFISNSLAISVPVMANVTVGGQDCPSVQRYLEMLATKHFFCGMPMIASNCFFPELL